MEKAAREGSRRRAFFDLAPPFVLALSPSEFVFLSSYPFLNCRSLRSYLPFFFFFECAHESEKVRLPSVSKGSLYGPVSDFYRPIMIKR